MAKQNAQNSDSGKTDPRLKSFLRKAAAIIAAEKGLNAASRLKLQTLAEHQKLPQPLFDEALTRLQQSAQLSSSLTHYEKAFVKFLDGELEKISSDIISPRVENEAIALARRKYEINSTRAEQLIALRAKAAGMSLISRQEAEAFADQSIVDQIGKLTSIDSDLSEQLHKIGNRWGLSPEDVEQIIKRKIARNEAEKKPPRWKWISISACMLAIAAILTGTAFVSGWIPGHWLGQFGANMDSVPSESVSIPEIIQLSRFADATSGEANELAKSYPELAKSIEKVFSDDETQRRSGYQSLVHSAISQADANRKPAASLTCKLFYADPDDESAMQVISTIESTVAIQPNEPPTIQQLKSVYRVNELIARLKFFEAGISATTVDRRTAVDSTIRGLTGLTIQSFDRAADYLIQSENAIATDQWNRVMQTAWSSPTQAAVLLQPLFDLTKSKLPAEERNDYRDDTVVSIMKSDSSRWRVLPTQIRQSVAQCDETKLMDWVSIFEASDDDGLRDLLAAEILPRIDVIPKSRSREEIGIAIESFGLQVRNQALRPVLDRNELLEKFFTNTMELEANDAESGISPDRIAQLALAVNVEWAFCAAIQNATHIDDSSFVEFDRLISIPSPRLRELISLPIDRRRDQATGPTSATASDKRRMNTSLERLSDVESNTSSLRELALKQLSQIAHRFERISYAEADILATYFLSNLKLGELLNVQKLVHAFGHWPNLSLAIADKLPSSQVDADQALTVLRLLLNREFELRSGTDWKRELQIKVYAAVSNDLENQIDLDPNNLKSNWIRLKIFLTDAYRERGLLDSDYRPQGDADTDPHLAAARLVEKMVDPRTSDGDVDIKRAVQLIYRSYANEIEKTVFANQLLIQTIIEEFANSDLVADAESLLDILRQKLQRQSLAGDKLYATEVALLQVIHLKRRMLVQQLLNQDNH